MTRKSRVVFRILLGLAAAAPLRYQHAPIRHKPDRWHDSTSTEYNLARGSEVAMRGDLRALANSDGRAAGRRPLVAGLRGKLVEQIDGACVHT